MRIKPQVGLVVGPADGTHWGQVLISPTGYGIVEISDSLGEAQSQGVRILSLLGKKLSNPLTSLSSVEDAVSAVWETGITSLIVLVPVGAVVYLVLRGMGNVYVKRGMELANLMHAEGGVSGEVREGDTILLVSHGFSRMLTHTDIVGMFDHLPAAEVAEKLTLRLHEKPGGEGSVALVFEVAGLEEITPLPSEPSAEVSEEPGGPPRASREKIISLLHAVRSLRHDPKRLTRAAAIALTSLFLISVAVGIWKQTVAKKNEHVTSVLSDARHAFEEGVALLDLNPVKGRERLGEAKNLLEPVLSLVNPRTREGRDVKLLYEQVGDNLTQSLQITEGALTLFYDMELLKKGASATSIALESTSLAIADEVGAAVYHLDIATKKAEVVAGGEQLVQSSLVALHGNSIYTLTPSGIVGITRTDKKLTTVVPKNDGWGNVLSLVSFGGNLYLLDTAKSRIWKYTATGETLPAGRQGFSDIREYLNPDTLPDLSMATNMTIDGAVWVGTKKGTIIRFVQGREETFVPKGVEPVFGTDLAVYVTDETQNIYVLDRINTRVVVLDKDGTYLAQYRFTANSSVRSFVVSEEQKKILLLAEGKLYSIDLR